MATTVTIQPTGVLYRKQSGTWGSANRLWDGDLTTAPTSQSNYVYLSLDFSFLPTGARITKIQARYYAKRSSGSLNPLRLRCSNTTSGGETEIAVFNLPSGSTSAEWHNAYNGNDIDTDLLMSKQYQLVVIPLSSNTTGYELYFDVTYEETDSKIYIGENKVSAVYVGTTKASAVYIGTTKVL